MSINKIEINYRSKRNVLKETGLYLLFIAMTVNHRNFSILDAREK